MKCERCGCKEALPREIVCDACFDKIESADKTCDCGAKLQSLHFKCRDFGGYTEIYEMYCDECSVVV